MTWDESHRIAEKIGVLCGWNAGRISAFGRQLEVSSIGHAPYWIVERCADEMMEREENFTLFKLCERVRTFRGFPTSTRQGTYHELPWEPGQTILGDEDRAALDRLILAMKKYGQDEAADSLMKTIRECGIEY